MAGSLSTTPTSDLPCFRDQLVMPGLEMLNIWNQFCWLSCFKCSQWNVNIQCLFNQGFSVLSPLAACQLPPERLRSNYFWPQAWSLIFSHQGRYGVNSLKGPEVGSQNLGEISSLKSSSSILLFPSLYYTPDHRIPLIKNKTKQRLLRKISISL